MKSTENKLSKHEWQKLHRLVPTAADASKIDWFALSDQHFPGRDAIELRSLYEFQTSEPEAVKPAKIRTRPSACINDRIVEVMREYAKHGDKSRVIDALGHELNWGDIVRRYDRVIPWRREDEVELCRLVDSRAPWPEISVALGRSMAACQQHYWRMLSPPRNSDLLAEPKENLSTLRPSLSLFIRRQFNVMGPNWTEMCHLFRIDVQEIRKILNRSLTLQHPFQHAAVDADDNGATQRRGRRWSSGDTARLMECIKNEQSRIQLHLDETGQRLEMNWTAIGAQLGRSATACRSRHAEFTSIMTHRHGRFSDDEDAVLVREWLKSGWASLRIESMPIPRREKACRGRLRTLFRHLIERKGCGYDLLRHQGVTVDDLKKDLPDAIFQSLHQPRPS